MQDYLIVKGQIDPIENELAPEEYKPNEWTKLDRIACATIRMHMSESVYCCNLVNPSCYSDSMFHLANCQPNVFYSSKNVFLSSRGVYNRFRALKVCLLCSFLEYK